MSEFAINPELQDFINEVYESTENLQPIEAEAETDTKTGTDWAEKLKSAEIDLKADLMVPPVCLSIDAVPVFFLGDISTTIGKYKGRKTFGSGLLLSSLAGNTTIGNRITGHLPENKRTVLYFDTEQGAYHAQKATKRILSLLGVDYLPNFKAYGLRAYNYQERLAMIRHAVYSTDNLGFVFIDGIRDLTFSINDEEQATLVTGELMKWSGELNIHINCILHMNKGDNNARGHLGTELMNKSGAVLGINKMQQDEQYSVIEAIATREREPEPIMFGIDFEGLPYLVGKEESVLFIKNDDTKKKAVLPTDWSNEMHKGFLIEIFEKEPERNYTDFLSALSNKFPIGTNKAKNFVTYFFDNGLITKRSAGQKTYYSLPVNQ